MTEDEARKKVCPLTFCEPYPPTNSMGMGSSVTVYSTRRSRDCIASGCMAWRWSLKDNPLYSKYMATTEPASIADDEHGYCGAFGVPNQ